MKAQNNNPVKTVLIISLGFGIIFFFLNFRWALNTALIIGLLGIISDRISKLIDFLWMKLAKVLSFIVPNILLSVIFYLFLFPLAILSRVFSNKSTLMLKNNKNSLWVDKNTSMDKVSFEKMW